MAFPSLPLPLHCDVARRGGVWQHGQGLGGVGRRLLLSRKRAATLIRVGVSELGVGGKGGSRRRGATWVTNRMLSVQKDARFGERIKGTVGGTRGDGYRANKLRRLPSFTSAERRCIVSAKRYLVFCTREFKSRFPLPS